MIKWALGVIAGCIGLVALAVWFLYTFNDQKENN